MASNIKRTTSRDLSVAVSQGICILFDEFGERSMLDLAILKGGGQLGWAAFSRA
jgi:hypothetical protein